MGDRGMLTEARIREEVHPARLDWISALWGPAIRTLVETGSVQLSLCDEQDLVEIRSDLYPGERLMVCRNPLMAQRRAHRREALLEPSVAATTGEKRHLRGEEQIGARVGTVIGRYRMAKHFDWSIDEHGVFHSERRAESIAEEAALDGLSIIRTSLPSAASCDTCADVVWAPGVFAAPCLASCTRYDAPFRGRTSLFGLLPTGSATAETLVF